MLIARVILLFFAFTSVIGVVWFFDSFEKDYFTASLISIICAFSVSMVPEKVIKLNKNVSMLLIFLAIVGIVALSIVIIFDLRDVGYSSGIIYRIIFIGGFLSVAIHLWKNHPGVNRNS